MIGAECRVFEQNCWSLERDEVSPGNLSERKAERNEEINAILQPVLFTAPLCHLQTGWQHEDSAESQSNGTQCFIVNTELPTLWFSCSVYDFDPLLLLCFSAKARLRANELNCRAGKAEDEKMLDMKSE